MSAPFACLPGPRERRERALADMREAIAEAQAAINDATRDRVDAATISRLVTDAGGRASAVTVALLCEEIRLAIADRRM